MDQQGVKSRHDDGAVLGNIPGVGADPSFRVDGHARSGPGGPRRSRKGVPLAVGLAALILLPAAWAGSIGDADAAQADDGSVTVASTHEDAVAGGEAEAEVPDPALPQTFARVGGLDLLLPDEQVLMIGFHEASQPDALAFAPVGDAVENQNTTKFTPPAEPEPGPDYIVLSSRGRPNPATSAVDLVMRDATPVMSPVDGTVVDVRPYSLYGKYPDTRIEIRPTAAPDHRVVIIHVSDVRVAVGDEVEAGRTGIAGGPNRFPFASHIDRYFEQERWPHVHIEVKKQD